MSYIHLKHCSCILYPLSWVRLDEETSIYIPQGKNEGGAWETHAPHDLVLPGWDGLGPAWGKKALFHLRLHTPRIVEEGGLPPQHILGPDGLGWRMILPAPHTLSCLTPRMQEPSFPLSIHPPIPSFNSLVETSPLTPHFCLHFYREESSLKITSLDRALCIRVPPSPTELFARYSSLLRGVYCYCTISTIVIIAVDEFHLVLQKWGEWTFVSLTWSICSME